jgi:hypothetical protein
MILPTKGIAPDQALLTVGARLLALLDRPKTVSRLWHEIQSRSGQPNDLRFDWFVLALDLLHMLGIVELEHGRLRKVVAPADTEGAP